MRPTRSWVLYDVFPKANAAHLVESDRPRQLPLFPESPALRFHLIGAAATLAPARNSLHKKKIKPARVREWTYTPFEDSA